MPFLPSLPLSLESDLLATFFDVFPGITALEASLSCTTSLNWPSESLTKDPGHSLGSFNGKAGWLWSGLSFLGLIERIFYWKSFISFRRHSSASLCGFSNSHSSPCLSAAFFSSNKACKGAISLLSCLLGFRVSEEEEEGEDDRRRRRLLFALRLRLVSTDRMSRTALWTDFVLSSIAFTSPGHDALDGQAENVHRFYPVVARARRTQNSSIEANVAFAGALQDVLQVALRASSQKA